MPISWTFNLVSRICVQLPLILGLVQVPKGFQDQAIIVNGPLLKPKQVHSVAGTTGAGVRSGPVPMEEYLVAFSAHFDHSDDHVRKPNHKFSCRLLDGFSTDRRVTIVDTQRTVFSIERCKSCRVLAALGSGILRRELGQLANVH